MIVSKYDTNFREGFQNKGGEIMVFYHTPILHPPLFDATLFNHHQDHHWNHHNDHQNHHNDHQNPHNECQIVTNLKNDIFSGTQLNHHVAGLPVNIPRLIIMMIIMIMVVLTMIIMMITMMMVMLTMTMMSFADSTVDDPRRAELRELPIHSGIRTTARENVHCTLCIFFFSFKL